MVIAMIGLSVYGWSKGNIENLIAPIDGNGNVCSQKLSGAKFLYIPFIGL